MGKLTTYIIIMSGLMLTFYFTGLLQECGDNGLCEGETPNSQLLNLLLKSEDMKSLTFGQNALLVMEGVSAILILAGGLFIGNIELAVMRSFAIYLFNLGWDFLVVFSRVKAANEVLAILLFAPLFIFYVITIVEWWRGRD